MTVISISKPVIEKDEIKAALQVLSSGVIAQASQVAKLEEQFAHLCQTKYAVATNNGTSALHTALYAIDIQPGDEVITTAFSFVATANSILMVGARPIFVDIDEKTFNIDVAKIKKNVTKKTKAIIVVNLFGQPADYREINYLAKKYHLKVIEDAAQSINAVYNGKKSGNLADISCFSLYATKNITCGEGGMVTTNNCNYFQRARRFRNHGQREGKKYDYIALGYNYRLTDFQAAVALAQLKKIDKLTKRRQDIAKKYNQIFKNIPDLIVPIIGVNRTHVFHQYTLRVTRDFKMNNDALKKYLLSKNIQSSVYYPKPLYQFKHLQFKKYHHADFSVVNKIVKEVLSIPVHPLLTNEEINYIVKTIIHL